MLSVAIYLDKRLLKTILLSTSISAWTSSPWKILEPFRITSKEIRLSTMLSDSRNGEKEDSWEQRRRLLESYIFRKTLRNSRRDSKKKTVRSEKTSSTTNGRSSCLRRRSRSSRSFSNLWRPQFSEEPRAKRRRRVARRRSETSRKLN